MCKSYRQLAILPWCCGQGLCVQRHLLWLFRLLGLGCCCNFVQYGMLMHHPAIASEADCSDVPDLCTINMHAYPAKRFMMRVLRFSVHQAEQLSWLSTRTRYNNQCCISKRRYSCQLFTDITGQGMLCRRGCVRHMLCAGRSALHKWSCIDIAAGSYCL
jgi:hypothetical protein